MRKPYQDIEWYRKRRGKCALCGKECELTFEHIPPEKAFNKSSMKPVSMMDSLLYYNTHPQQSVFDMDGIHFYNLQRGHGLYSLCKSCNNMTGTYYGNEYVSIARSVGRILPIKGENDNCIIINEIYPLRFIKQVLSMFCSLNANTRIDDIRHFVLDKDTFGGLIGKYRVYMYFTNYVGRRYSSLQAVLRFDNHSIICCSEICHYPFGFVLCFNPEDDNLLDLLDITHFTEYGYDFNTSIELQYVYREANTAFPLDFRRREEIEPQ